jgi:MFS family permease
MTVQTNLLRDSGFLRVWLSFSSSEVGTNVAIALLPLMAVALLHASPVEMGLLATANTLPYVIAGPLVGVLADRIPRRRILVVTDIVRAGIFIFAALISFLGFLSFKSLYLVAFFAGLCHVWYDIAHGSYLPFVVDRTRLISANSYTSLSQSVANTGGPTAAGVVMQGLGAVFGLGFCAAAYVISALLLFRSNPGRPQPTSALGRRSVLSEMADGLKFVWGTFLLRRLTIRHVVWHFMVGAIYSQLIFLLVNETRLSLSAVGVMLSMVGVGTVIAAATAARLSARIGVGMAIMRSNLFAALSLPLLVIVGGSGLASILCVGIALVIYGYCFITYQINNASLRQVITPDAMLGRLTAAVRVSTLGANALGAVISGALAQLTDSRTAIGCFAAVAIVLAVRGMRASPLLAIHELPARHNLATA